MAEVKKVSHTHEAILVFMIANPTAPLGFVAAHFGYTQPWLSTLIHSDAFQAQLHKRQDELYGTVVTMELKDKIVGCAHLAIDKLGEKIEVAQNISDVTDAAEMLLKSLGYGGPKAVPAVAIQQNNVYNFADKETLARSRALIAAASASAVVGVIEGDEVEINPPRELEHVGSGGGGSAIGGLGGGVIP